MKLSDIQRNAERQLNVVLNNIAAEDMSVPVTLDFQPNISSAEAAFNEITAKASEIQGRGMFGDEAMIAGAAELATYFSDEQAIMSMMDTLADYAAGMSMGQEVSAKQMVDYATNLGKITNGTYTAMSQKGFQFSEAQRAIIGGTASQAQIVETLGEEYLGLSQDMQAAAAINQVITERWNDMYEGMSDTPAGKIAQMKNAFGDVREEIGDRLYPAVLQFVDVFNKHLPQVTSLMRGFAGVCSMLIIILTAIFAFAASVGSAIVDNWDMIGPVVYGIAAALAVYNAEMGIAWLTILKNIAAKIAHAAASAAETVAIFVLIAAQEGLNAAMLACPISWIIMGIIALIAAITAVCAWFARSSDVAQSAFGVMAGGINVVIHFLGNLLAFCSDVCLAVGGMFLALVYNIVTAFNNGICNIKGFFWDLLSDALTVINNICEALNKLPFVEFDYSGVSAMADKFAAKSAAAYNSKTDYVDIVAAAKNGFNTMDFFKDGWASEAWQAGANWGDNLASKFSLPSLEDGFDAYGLGDRINGIYDNVADTAANTAAAADSLEFAEEDLKYMRDIAEREAVNRFTTAEIVVNMGGITNNVKNNNDLDGIVDRVLAGTREAIEIGVEGVHI